MPFTVQVTQPERFDDFLRQYPRAVSGAVSAAIEAATTGLVTELRQAVEHAAPHGRYQANVWGSRFYKNQGFNAAGLVFVRSTPGGHAYGIVSAFDQGAVIRPRGGKKFLAIPTGFNRRGGRRAGEPLVTPAQMIASKQSFTVPAKAHTDVLVWMLAVNRAQRKSRGRATDMAVAGGLLAIGGGKRKRIAEALASGAVPMFTLVPEVNLGKRMDVDSIVRRWADALPELLDAALPGI